MLPAFYHILPSTKLALTEDANVESAAIAHGGEFILTSENGYHLAIGPTAEATDDDLYIPANTVFPIVLAKGERYRCSRRLTVRLGLRQFVAPKQNVPT